jgi:hypothetical protein
MGKHKLKPHLKKSIIKNALESAKQKSTKHLVHDEFVLISFRHLDPKQGDTLGSWEESKILSRALETLTGACSSKFLSVFSNSSCKIYIDFPPSAKTEFKHPDHVPEDAKWASMHITGRQCIIGHVINNVFYIVFLDGEHKFWISELKHT